VKVGRSLQNVCMVHRQTNICQSKPLFSFDRFQKLFGFLRAPDPAIASELR